MMLHIKDWYKTFAYAHANRLRSLPWRKKPCSHNSPRFRRLMRTQDGRTAYCVFEAIVDLVFRYRSDGILVDDHEQEIGPTLVHESASIPLAECRAGFKRLQDKDIGWLSKTDVRGSPMDQRSSDNPPSAAENGQRVRSESDRIKKKRNTDLIGGATDRGKTTRPDLTDERKREFDKVVEAVQKCGMSEMDAIALAATPGQAEAIWHAALKTQAEIARGTKIRNVRNYIERVAGIRKALAEKVADRRHELRVASRRPA